MTDAGRWLAPGAFRGWSAQGVEGSSLRSHSFLASLRSADAPGLAHGPSPASRTLRAASRPPTAVLDPGDPGRALCRPYRQAQNACRPLRGVVAAVERVVGMGLASSGVALPCPWCGFPVDLVSLVEMRTLARINGQRVSHTVDHLVATTPGWWCTCCHAGGALLDRGDLVDVAGAGDDAAAVPVRPQAAEPRGRTARRRTSPARRYTRPRRR